jgi:serine protease Do
MRPALALAALVLAAPVSAAAQAPTPGSPVALGALSHALEEVAARVRPSVVQIQVTAYGPVAAGTTAVSALIGSQRITGSGVILTPDGYIVTNAHVVEGGRRFTVVLPRPAAAGVPGRSAVAPVSQELAATLVGTDSETDLALLKVEATRLPVAVLGESDSLQPGQMVLAFGSPLGLTNSVTLGVISAIGRQLREEDRMVYIQTDTPINPGSSGGPLVNAEGQVVGINTLILSQSGGSEGIGFAAPSDIVRFVAEQLRTSGRVRRGEIGVFAQTVTPALAAGLTLPRDWGVVLGDVYPGGPAARAGLRVGDMIFSVNGKPMENGRQFDVNLYRHPIGSRVTLDVGRGVTHLILQVPVVERREPGDRFLDLVTPERNLVPRIGILALDLTPELAEAIPGLRDPRGVVVAGVAVDARAPAGLEPGDVIYSMNGTRVRTLAELRGILAQISAEGTAILQVGRQGQLRFVTVVTE